MSKHNRALAGNGHYAANLDAEAGEILDPDFERLVRVLVPRAAFVAMEPRTVGGKDDVIGDREWHWESFIYWSDAPRLHAGSNLSSGLPNQCPAFTRGVQSIVRASESMPRVYTRGWTASYGTIA